MSLSSGLSVVSDCPIIRLELTPVVVISMETVGATDVGLGLIHDDAEQEEAKCVAIVDVVDIALDIVDVVNITLDCVPTMGGDTVTDDESSAPCVGSWSSSNIKTAKHKQTKIRTPCYPYTADKMSSARCLV